MATLEGPGVNKSVCPACGQPCWKKELKRNCTINNLVDVVRCGLDSLPRRNAQLAAACEGLKEQLGAVLPAAAGADTRSGADPAAPRASSGRRRSAKPRQLGRPVPQEERPQHEQHGQLRSAGVPAMAAAAALTAPDQAAGTAAATKAVAQQAGNASAVAPGRDGAAPITPGIVEYDSDWEARVRLLFRCVTQDVSCPSFVCPGIMC